MISPARNLFLMRRPRFAGRILALAVMLVPVLAPTPALAMQSEASGVIRGTVEVQRAPPRRSTQRYRGGRAQAARAVQELPAVIYLRGAPRGSEGPGSPETVLQQDTAFVPAVLVVPPGTTINFGNSDPFFHNVFSYSQAQRFDLGRYPAGQTKSVTFEEAGVVKVYCEVHDFMRAVVLVLDSPYHSRVSEDGSFTISGVPPGAYEMVAWHADFDEQVIPITVTGGETETFEVTIR